MDGPSLLYSSEPPYPAHKISATVAPLLRTLAKYSVPGLEVFTANCEGRRKADLIVTPNSVPLFVEALWAVARGRAAEMAGA